MRFPIIMATVLLLATQPAAARLQILACEPEWGALASALGGDKVEVHNATTAQQDPHHIQARPSLIASARQADLLICSGAGLEAGWLPLLLRKSGNPKIQPGAPGHLMAAEQVALLDKPKVLDRSEGDIHAEGNPHLHLDPRRLAAVARVLEARLIAIDGANGDHYRQRGSAFQQRWSEAIGGWEQRAAPLKGMRVVVHHRNWRYLFDWLAIEEAGTLEPKPGIPPNTAHLAALAQTMARQPAALIIRTPYQEARPSRWLAERSGVAMAQLPYTVGGSSAANDLFALFDETLGQLLAAQR